MQGPYDYEPPSYWYGDRDGAAFGFATEIGTGKTLPSIEDMRRMLGDDHLWPRDNAWTLHSQGGAYTPFTPFEDAMRLRYGAATKLDDYVRKAQLIAYDNERAMFEAYGRNKYKSTGVIKWMLNNAWPSLAWHLYDYYLEAGSGYYGTKKSLEPLHVQYSFDDRSIVVVNSTLNQSAGLKVRAVVADISGTTIWLRASMDARPGAGRQGKFSYSADGQTFTPIGAAYSLNNDWPFYPGYRYGIFNLATTMLGGSVKVKSFQQTVP